MGHDSERATLIYQHEARGADKRITDAIDFHVHADYGPWWVKPTRDGCDPPTMAARTL
jgi:hypothetical protein